MARRTSATRVRSVNPRIPSTFDLDMAIDSASSLVDELATCASADGNTLSDQRLELIESWIAAHFAYIAQPTNIQSKSVGGASQSYLQASVNQGIDASPYGTQAVLLDTSGCLDKLLGEKVNLFWAAGEDEVDYDVDWN